MLTDRQCEVINAFAFAGMNKTKAAKMLGCHYQNVRHHLAVIKERTGKDPNDFFDLHDLFEMVGGNEIDEERRDPLL